MTLWLLAVAPAAAQTMRSYDYARPYHGEQQLRARVVFAAGRLRLRAGGSEQLYQLLLQYDTERFRPVGSYDAGSGLVRMGVEGNGSGGIRIGRRNALPQTAAIEFSTATNLSLEVSLGAADAELELGGLRLAELDIQSGASRAEVSFARPNPGRCRSASLASGAGEVTVLQAGNSGCPAWHFEGGVGAVTIDLGGAWPADARITLQMALGGVTLRAPKELGVRVRMSGFLAGFEGSGFSKAGKTYTSAGYDAAKRRVDVEVSSALGGVTVEWR